MHVSFFDTAGSPDHAVTLDGSRQALWRSFTVAGFTISTAYDRRHVDDGAINFLQQQITATLSG